MSAYLRNLLLRGAGLMPAIAPRALGFTEPATPAGIEEVPASNPAIAIPATPISQSPVPSAARVADAPRLETAQAIPAAPERSAPASLPMPAIHAAQPAAPATPALQAEARPLVSSIAESPAAIPATAPVVAEAAAISPRPLSASAEQPIAIHAAEPLTVETRETVVVENHHLVTEIAAPVAMQPAPAYPRPVDPGVPFPTADSETIDAVVPPVQVSIGRIEFISPPPPPPPLPPQQANRGFAEFTAARSHVRRRWY